MIKTEAWGRGKKGNGEETSGKKDRSKRQDNSIDSNCGKGMRDR